MRTRNRSGAGRRRAGSLGLLVGGIAASLVLVAPVALAHRSNDRSRHRAHEEDDGHQGHGPHGGICAQTAELAASACQGGISDDFATASARCLNVTDADQRQDCFAEARSALAEDRQLCRAQLAARNQVCGLVGGGAYDPSFAPEDFVADFAHPSASNPYFPLRIGDRWQYASEDQDDSVEVLDRTKSIEDVTCVVVHDVVSEDGQIVEDTEDWIAQALNGDVFYCGEQSQELESFPGDSPVVPELVSIEGSFKAGREGAKPGTLFLGAPTVGAAYRQEFALGEAEDVAQVLAVDYGPGRHPELDTNVPRDLVDALCAADDCVVTRELTALEPGAVERKYYARGIGVFLTLDLGTGEVEQLVGCNVDPRCDELPEP